MSHIGKPLAVDYSTANPALLDMAARFAMLCADLHRAETDLRTASGAAEDVCIGHSYRPQMLARMPASMREAYGIVADTHAKVTKGELRKIILKRVAKARKEGGDVIAALDEGGKLLTAWEIMQKLLRRAQKQKGIPQLMERRDAVLKEIAAAMDEIAAVPPLSMADAVIQLQVWRMRYEAQRPAGADVRASRQTLVHNALTFLTEGVE
ncbi:hypothetical protein SAMN02982917_0561 [Azospirillum oryzae]|uniref:Uncharacterized protein n=1 Tax=Azospirillum oryzae TaxID=286727 RepID=A0A1X7HUJ8_9PROT|nr:hypothetical protein [Azospirillum oryzae]SMF92323.1 hypothetical protein SAMN02982917_0561 [Azospirillum oryzae]